MMKNALVAPALALVAGIVLAAPAHADFGQQTMGMSLSPYKPDLDSEKVDGHRIFPFYDCVFDDQTILEFGGDVDTHLWDGFGSLQLSLGANLGQAQGFARKSAAAGVCGEASDTEVQMTLLKVRPGVTYRFDPFLDWWSVPLVPYARAGLVFQGYMFTADGDFDTSGKTDPVGLRYGWEAALGLMLALDFLDAIDPFVPDTTRRARANGVFDHTFFYVEGAYQRIDNFGAPGFVFTPRDELFNTGLPVLWKAGLAVELL
jgi:hypothetical protein